MRVSKAARGLLGGKLSNAEFEDAKLRASAECKTIERDLLRAGNDGDFAQRRPSASIPTLNKAIENLGRGQYIEKKFGVARSSGAVWYRGMLVRQPRGCDVSIWEVATSLYTTIERILMKNLLLGSMA